MPGSQFQSRGNLFFKDGRRRDTVSLAADRQEPQSSGDIFAPIGGAASDVTGFAGRLFEGVQNVGPNFMNFLARTVTDAPTIPQVADFDPSQVLGPVNPTTLIASEEERFENIRSEIFGDDADPTLMTRAQLAARKARQLEHEAELADIAANIGRAESSLESNVQNFETGTMLLEALGLPATVESAREDPEVAEFLDAVSSSLQRDGRGLEEALDQLATLGEDKLDELGEAFGRTEYLNLLQTSVKTQIHNLVENRQQVEAAFVEAENAAEKEARSQNDPLFDLAGDPSPSGRGEDAMIAHMEPMLVATFSGVLTEPQFIEVNKVMSDIWNALPSVEVDEETGEPKGGIVLTPAAISALTAVLGNGIPGELVGLAMSPDKIESLIQHFEAAVQRGVEAREQAEGWKTAERLPPGEAGMQNAIYDVALDIYEDTEIAEAIGRSGSLHSLIQIRSDGNVGRTEKDSNQFGIGNLPEHTYEALGYTLDMVEDNPEEQVRALLHFIGTKYGAGYEGILVAYDVLKENPDAWGEMP